ncbi:MAG: glycosyltransferase family 4 protein [Rubritalea sp.]|uniref:glycosyltransferase family 4 protein n=1 Tax=Rubritalea sp. TaxID=2109375 RepID=UPI003242E87E
MSLVFYDDSPIFGGHEVMSLAGLDALLNRYSKPVFFYATEANSTLCERLAELEGKYDHLRISNLPWHSSKLEGLRNRLKPARARQLQQRFERLGAKLVVAVQGNIEHSSLALHACKKANIRSVSYIPVPHSNRVMGAKLGRMRDLFSRSIFKLPDSYLTISEEMASLLRQRGAVAPIKIVYNGIDIHRFQEGVSHEARKGLQLPPNKILLGVVGRVEFRQKQQQLLVEAVSSVPSLVGRCHLVFAGDGPDSDCLKRLLAAKGVSHTIIPWCDTAPLYQALDALVIPSRYEGLPLVMLEALSSRITVFGSDRDGMRDILPDEYRFAVSNVADLSRTIHKWVDKGCPPPAEELVNRIRSKMSKEQFAESFSREILAKLTR